eukprot:g2156.t1
MNRWICVLVFLTVAVCSNGQQRKARCKESHLGYDCMASLSDEYNLHWTLDGMIVQLAMDVETVGWCGFCFAGRPLNMAPADAAIGWIDFVGVTLRPYHLYTKFVDPEDEDFNVKLTNINGTERDGRTVIHFTRNLTQGEIPVDPEEITPVNFAFGIVDRLDYHFKRGSSAIRFADTQEDTDDIEDIEDTEADDDESRQQETNSEKPALSPETEFLPGREQSSEIDDFEEAEGSELSLEEDQVMDNLESFGR